MQRRNLHSLLFILALAVAGVVVYGLVRPANNGAPPPPTVTEKGAVQVKAWTPEGQHPFPAKILYNYKPLLRVDSGISVRPLQIETVHGPKGFVSTLWARRAKESIIVDWESQSVTPGQVNNI